MEQTQITKCEKEKERAYEVSKEKWKVQRVEFFNKLIYSNSLTKTFYEFQKHHTNCQLIIPKKSKDLNSLKVIRSTEDGDRELWADNLTSVIEGYRVEEGGYKLTMKSARQILADELDMWLEQMGQDESEKRADQEYNTWCRQNDVDDIGVY